MGNINVFTLSVFLLEPLLPFRLFFSVPGGPAAEALRPECDDGFIGGPRHANNANSLPQSQLSGADN